MLSLIHIFTLSHGRGYVPADRNKPAQTIIGLIPVDSIYTPVKKVNYTVENTRVGDLTDFDKLTLEVWTNGTITARDAVSLGARILCDHFMLFTDLSETMGNKSTVVEKAEAQRDKVLELSLIHISLERGYGTTLGNSLRRILLSSLPGTAVTSIKIAGIQHEFSTIPGVKEDVTEIVLNVKGIIAKLHSEGVKTVYIEMSGEGEVTAGDIKADGEVEVLNPTHHIATPVSYTHLGYCTASGLRLLHPHQGQRPAGPGRHERRLGRCGHRGVLRGRLRLYHVAG